MDPRGLPWDTYNVAVVTMDACRYDSALYAQTPVLDSLGPLRRAVTPGTFTLPAHMAFFSGYLPNVIERPLVDLYSREAFQLWRLSRAKQKARDSYGIHLEGDDIVEGFRRRGFYTIGVGGVRWFLTNTLRGLFDEFLFWGPDDYRDWFALRRPLGFALDNVDAILQRIHGHERWFLFANALETHAPYDNGFDEVSADVMDVITKASPIWAGRITHEDEIKIHPEEFRVLHNAQVRAVEAIDFRLGRLVEVLPRPYILVVCGDHGECFGEEGKWGHGFPAPAVYEVPIVVGIVE